MDTITVAVCTFGDKKWRRLGDRAAESCADLEADQLIRVHYDKSAVRAAGWNEGHALAVARNSALAQAKSEYIVYLDGDDWLAPDYVRVMRSGKADIRIPSVSGMGIPRVPGHLDHRSCGPACLLDRNYIVVGAAARVSVLRDVGGWRALPCLEDWELWRRCYLAGASFERRPEARYNVSFHPNSRGQRGMQVEDRVVAGVKAGGFPKSVIR